MRQMDLAERPAFEEEEEEERAGSNTSPSRIKSLEREIENTVFAVIGLAGDACLALSRTSVIKTRLIRR